MKIVKITQKWPNKSLGVRTIRQANSHYGAGLLRAMLAALLFCACAPQISEKSVKLSHTRYLLAEDYFQNKKNAEAAKGELVQALDLDPNNGDAHELLGIIFFLEGMNAINFMERRNCLDGAAKQEQQEVADIKLRSAQEHLEKCLAVTRFADNGEEKSNTDVLNYLANIDFHFKQYAKAIERTTIGLKDIVYPAKHLLLGTRGWAYLHQGQFALAERDLRQALFQMPNFCVGHYRLAKAYADQDKFQLAITELQSVVADKACPLQDAYLLLGEAYIHLHQGAQARDIFTKCIESNPQSCAALSCARYRDRS